MTAPLRFLSGVIGLWCLGRAGVLLWPEGAFLPVEAADRIAPGVIRLAEPAQAAPTPLLAPAPGGSIPLVRPATADAASESGPSPFPQRSAPLVTSTARAASLARATALASGGFANSSPVEPQQPPSPTPATPADIARTSRGRALAGVRVSSWALWRPGQGGSVGLGAGSLGGSQAGVRALLPILGDGVPRLALSARVSAPLRRRGAEAALGVEWQPSADLPLRLLAERRQRIAGEGRSAFALLAHGGVSERALGRGLLDAYGAVGMVGARSRDPFAEGAATVTHKLGPVRIGAGAWGGAQPGASRLDVGPTIALPLRVGDAGARVSLDYRLRVAGAAAPGSGPALTIGTDF